MKSGLTILLWISAVVRIQAFQTPARTTVAFKENPSFPSLSYPPTGRLQTTLPMSSPDAEPNDEENYEKSNNSPQEGDKKKPSGLTESLIAAIGSTTSLAVAGSFYVVLCYKRDSFMVSFFIGAILNGILSKVLKRILGEARPESMDTSGMDLAPSDNGMPSSHAMSLGFIGTFTALTLPQTTLPLLMYCLISLVYRVQSNLHTVAQVGVGGVVGTLNGALWWKLCTEGMVLGGKTIHVADWVKVSSIMDPTTGKMPWYLLSIPTLVGALVVGSIERRISQYLSKRKGKKD